MAHAGQVLDHPIFGGQYYTFLKTARDTQGEVLAADIDWKQGAWFRPHMHLGEESWEVISGRLWYWIETPQYTHTINPGERVVFPPKVPHNHGLLDDGDAHVIREVRPAGNEEIAIEALAGLGRDGKTTEHGLPKNLFELILVSDLAGIYEVGLPLPLARVVTSGVARVAERLGHQKHFPQYSDTGGLLVKR